MAVSPEVAVQLQTRRLMTNRKRKPRRPPVWLYPRTIERRYTEALVGYVERIGEIVRRTVIPHLESIVASREAVTPTVDRADTYAEEIERLMEGTTLQVGQIPFNKAQVAKDIGYSINEFNSKQWDKQLKVSLGVDVFQREEFVPSTISSFVKENASLITKMETDMLNTVEETIQRSVRAGESAGNVAKKIESRIGVSKSRARLIARDQTGKLNGQMTELRQTNTGIKKYIWRTSLDERVRATHRAHNGVTYEWGKPPANTGAPGQDYQCRCYAEPDFDDFLESFEANRPGLGKAITAGAVVGAQLLRTNTPTNEESTT